MTFAVLLWFASMAAGDVAALNASPATVPQTEKSDSPKSIPTEGFYQLEKVEGKGWSLVCAAVEGDDAYHQWGAILKVGSEERFRTGEQAPPSKEGVKYYLWPSPEKARWLCVYVEGNRFYNLDVFDMKHGFNQVLFSGAGFEFNRGSARLTDLNGDGTPEFVGISDGFQSVSTMPWDFSTAEEPCPVAIMTYDAKIGRYRSAAFLFPSYTAEVCAGWEAQFRVELNSFGRKGPDGRYSAEILKNKYGPPVALVWWLLELIYSGREDEAWAALDKHCEPDVAKAIRDGIEATLKKDKVYQDMLVYRKEKGKS